MYTRVYERYALEREQAPSPQGGVKPREPLAKIGSAVGQEVMSCCVGPAQPRQRLQSAAPGRPEGRRLALDFDFDLKRPVKPRRPSAGSEPWATRQDAGLAALGQGWPIAAAHGSVPERGHAEPRRGTEWWGKSVLLTFALLSKVSRRKGGTITRHPRKNGYVHQGLRALRTRAGASSLATGAVNP